jgi:hypothetical protein
VTSTNGAGAAPAIADSDARKVVLAGELDGGPSKPSKEQTQAASYVARDIKRFPRTKAPTSSARDYVLGELRCAALRARLAACEIDTIGVALRAGWINHHIAIEWLHDRSALDYVAPASPRGSI